jgi:hypothetical protein
MFVEIFVPFSGYFNLMNDFANKIFATMWHKKRRRRRGKIKMREEKFYSVKVTAN